MLISNEKNPERAPTLAEKIQSMRSEEQQLEHNHERWTPDEAQQLGKMFWAGVGISEIALELGRTERTVVQKLNALKLYGVKQFRRTKDDAPSCLCFQCRSFSTWGIRAKAGQPCPLSDQ